MSTTASSSIRAVANRGNGSGSSTRHSLHGGYSISGLQISRAPALHQRFPTPAQASHQANLSPPNTSTQWGEGRGQSHVSILHRTAAAKQAISGPTNGDTHADNISQLVQLGFSDEQAARVQKYLQGRKDVLNINYVRQFLQLMNSLAVEQPFEALSKNSMIFSRNPDTVRARAEPLIQWMLGMGLTRDDTSTVFERFPSLLIVPLPTLIAKAEWFGGVLGWDGCFIRKLLMRKSTVFALSVAHAQAQLVALEALGLSHAQVFEVVRKQPCVLGLDISGPTTQLKVKFMVQVMGLPVTRVTRDPGMLTRSLTNTIGPRWAFSLLYCSDQPTPSTNSLSKTAENYTNGLKSASLDTECLSRKMTRMQRFEEFKAQWQQGEGRAWCKPGKVSLSEIQRAL